MNIFSRITYFFLFAWNLMNYVRDNFKPSEVEIIKKQLLKDKKKCDHFEIQSDKNNFTGKPLDGKTINNCKDEDIKRVLDSFMFKGKWYYLVGGKKETK